MIIIALIIGILFASLEGYREAYHFYYRVSSTRQDTYNEHSLFAIQRIIIWLPVEYMAYDPSNCLTLLNGLFIGLTFILWHDGIYYWKYNKLAGVYPKGFWDQSKNSTSWMDRHDLTNPVFRITYFIIGIVGLIIINYANY